MTTTVDTVVTVVLFVALIPAVAFAFVIGFHLIMLGDNASSERPRSGCGLLVGVVGVPLSAGVIYTGAVIFAWMTPGHTFYIPLIALAVGVAVVVGLSGLADWLVKHL